MRLIAIICLCLFIIPLALAAPDVIFDKTISHGTSISLNDSTYKVLIGSSNNSLVKLVSSFETIEVKSGKCVDKNYDTFCYVAYDEYQKIDAIQTDYRPFIDVDRFVGSKKLDLGERTTISLTFENTGGTDIDDFYFSETVPLMLTVISAEGCSISKDNSQKIVLEKTLRIDTPLICEYVIEAGEVGLGVYAGKLFTNELVSSRDAQAIPQVAITTKNVFNLDITSSVYDLDIAQPFTLTFSIENIDSGSRAENLTIHNISIDIEDEFVVTNLYESPFIAFSNSKKFKFSGLISPEETLEQKVDLESLTLDKNISVEVYVYYQIGSDPISSFKRVISLTQTFHPLWCEYVVVDDAGNNLISLEKLNHQLLGYDRGEVFVYVYNENAYVSATNIIYFDSGDIEFSSGGKLNALRKNDKDILTSKLFSFDRLDKFDIKSDMRIKYKILDENMESFCNGDIQVQKPTFLSFEKELFFVNVSIDKLQEKLLPRVKLTISNIFFLPINDIKITEILPSSVFSNNNTQKTLSLGVLEDDYFEFDFIVPEDYVSLDGSTFTLETEISYVIYDKEFTESVFLEINTNDIISAQKGFVLDSLIDAKINQLKDELNETIIASQKKELTNSSVVPPITYSPFLDYFSIAMMIFLLFLAFIFLNIRYGFRAILKKWFVNNRVKKLVKKEESFAKSYSLFKKRELSYSEKLLKGKKLLKSLEETFRKQQKSFKKAVKTIKSKELVVDGALHKEQRMIDHLNGQKILLEKKIASISSLVTSQENKKQTLGVERAKQKAELEKIKTEVLKVREYISQVQANMTRLDNSLDKMKSDFETSYSKNKSVLDSKLTKVKGDLSHLDEEYISKRKILKEEEEHLEHNE